MDRNSITGLFLIGVIIIGFSFLLSPSDQEIKELQYKQDSIAQVKKQDSILKVQADTSLLNTANVNPSENNLTSDTSAAQIGSIDSIENDKIKVYLNSLGAKVQNVLVKNQYTWDKQALYLYQENSNQFGLSFYANNELVNTNNKSFVKVSSTENTIVYRLYFSENTSNNYLQYSYSIDSSDYMVDFDIECVGLGSIMNQNNNYFDIAWNVKLNKLEKDLKKEREYSTVYLKYTDDDIDNISPSDDEPLTAKTPVKWVSFKQHFFSSVLIADKQFENANFKKLTPPTGDYLINPSTQLSFNFNRNEANQSYGMQFYFGPNHFNTLNEYDLGLERQINLGWGPLKYINRFAVIPVFNTLSNWGLNYGLIILILTILLKVVLSPLTYSSYLSTAKMKVLKPEMDEIKAKLGEDDAAKLQQEYLKLYKKAGVNPLGGCIPMLLQMPILFAFFFFFPSSFELRQESFLWATDLSTYDSVWDFGIVPIVNTIYGDHVSLFCLLMTVSTLIYTRMNNQISGATGQMKWMGYIMPVVFMGVLNSLSAGLNYYYFCANMITFGQQWLIRKFVNDDEIHRRIQENKKKPVKKSKFQERLEGMAKAQQAQRTKRK
jgi:YidC/Oxa1 family membrane protein insertase